MELRVLRYFLAIAQAGSITKAAQTLHITQPTLSRQIKELVDELGKELIRRGSRQTELTHEGLLLRQRAEEIVGLAERTKKEFHALDTETISGDLNIGCGESDSLSFITDVLKGLHDTYPLIISHFYSGNTEAVLDRLDKGLLDFAVIMGLADSEKYASLPLPGHDTWGLLMPRDCALAEKPGITPEDMTDLPIICSSQSIVRDEFSGWLGYSMSRLHIVATYTLLFNASLLVRSGLGYALCFDKLVSSGPDSPFVFRPLTPAFTSSLFLVWKKQQLLSQAAEAFLKETKEAGRKL